MCLICQSHMFSQLKKMKMTLSKMLPFCDQEAQCSCSTQLWWFCSLDFVLITWMIVLVSPFSLLLIQNCIRVFLKVSIVAVIYITGYLECCVEKDSSWTWQWKVPRSADNIPHTYWKEKGSMPHICSPVPRP